MRLPNGFVKHTTERLARKLSGRRAPKIKARFAFKRKGAGASKPTRRFAPKLGGVALKLRGVALKLRGRLALKRSGRLSPQPARERLARSVVVALVLLLGGGTAGALALLPPEDLATEQADLDSGAAPRGFAEGELGDRRTRPRRAGPDYYRKTTTRHVPASVETGFLPLYREAERTFGVSWRLLASIHRQETAFSSVPSTYHGLNDFGCCAGPMQFNVTNGPPSTWALHRQSFRLGARPRTYPHRTRRHPSIYDDFDAIMAAGALLRDSGAGEALDIASWSAAYAYYGHDRFGTEYASQVLGRAAGWERYGFCLNCPDDASLVAEFDDSYGEEARRQLDADNKKAKKKKKKRKKDRNDRAKQERTERPAPDSASTQRGSPVKPEPAVTTPAPEPSTTTTTTTETTPQPATPPPAAAKTCTKLERLLGCRE